MSDREEFRLWTGLAETDGREPRGVDIDHGEYFSSSQAARELGVSRARVTSLRKSGTLMRYRLRRASHPENSGGNPWWFYLKEDVWALRADLESARRKRSTGTIG